MPKMEFAYTSKEPSAAPRNVRRIFSVDEGWTVTTQPVDDLLKRQNLPDFVWLDLGREFESKKTEQIIDGFAALQDRTEKPTHILVTGESPSSRIQSNLTKEIYSRVSNPGHVDVSFERRPNLRAFLTRFEALRRVAEKAKAAAILKRKLRVPNADLRTEKGNLSIKNIADLYALPIAELGRLIHRPSRAALVKTPDADSLQEPLRPFADIASFREAANGNVEFRKWLRATNDSMQGRSPLDWIREGRVRDVAGFVHGALTGQAT